MRYFSMFSGIGGFELGIQHASNKQPATIEQDGQRRNGNTDEVGHDVLSTSRTAPLCVGYSEIDKYAIKTYERNFSGHRNYGDATRIEPTNLPDFDILVGGFPCQAFSIAGKRKGFDDTRGTLFFDIARILAEKRPRHLVLENVKGLLSHDSGKTFQTILGVLSDLGYRVEWQVLNSKDFGVPQNRGRIYFIGHLRGECSGQVFPIRGSDKSFAQVHPTIDANYYKGYSNQRRMIQQVNNPTHSNDRVYATDGISPTLNTMQGGNRQPFVKVPEATKKGYAEASVGQAINLSVPNSKTRRGRVSDVAPTLDTGMQIHTLVDDTYGTGLREYKDTAPTLRTGRHGLKVSDDVRIRRLTPIECERLQGFPDNWTAGESDTQRYKMCGNAVTTNVVEAVITNLIKHMED